MTTVALKIAGIIIRMQSRFPQSAGDDESESTELPRRFKAFYHDYPVSKPDIQIDVQAVRKLPSFKAVSKRVFFVHHPDDGSNNWQLFVRGREYIYESLISNKRQVMVINSSFNSIKAYMLCRKGKKLCWNPSDIIYDFLQVLLIHYLAQRNEGIFVHACGIRQAAGTGFLFAGKSGAGKTTLAKIWYAYDPSAVLNDDRVIIRFVKGKFMLYASPWHGDFSDYLASVKFSGKTSLKRILFISHSRRNAVRPMALKKSFPLFYTTIFPTFWNKAYLENIVSFYQHLLSGIPCFSMGFVKNKTVVNFIKRLH